MFIKCWGSRGSIPVSGLEYIKYGGDTTCIEIRTESNDVIIIDAGTGVRRLGNKLVEEKRKKLNFLFTHAHWDHLMGFPFFKPLYKDETTIEIYGCPFPGNYIENVITKVMTPPNFPVQYSDLKAKIHYNNSCNSSFQIGSASISYIPLSHPNGGRGYKLVENGRTFVFLTDNELGHEHPGGLSKSDYIDFCKGADLLIHDAEYTPEEYKSTVSWGHSAWTDTLEVALKAGVKKLGLFHLNQERTDSEMDAIVDSIQKEVSDFSIKPEIFAVASDMEFII